MRARAPFSPDGRGRSRRIPPRPGTARASGGSPASRARPAAARGAGERPRSCVGTGSGRGRAATGSRDPARPRTRRSCGGATRAPRARRRGGTCRSPRQAGAPPPHEAVPGDGHHHREVLPRAERAGPRTERRERHRAELYEAVPVIDLPGDVVPTVDPRRRELRVFAAELEEPRVHRVHELTASSAAGSSARRSAGRPAG